ncbi:MAG: apolipoprotein N-acyltransferase [Candidatus Solibacter usitatus]|nr:apolipoprotein N-acyltransferase [Candidatus Solibacter usitatus]
MKRPALILLSAILSILCFAPANLFFLAPFALTPAVMALCEEPSAKRRMLYGWCAGFVYWFGVCYWIRDVLAQYGGMHPALVWLAFLLFCILRSLHWAAFGLLAGYVTESRIGVIAIAALWTGLERCYGPFGFAWLVLGNAGIPMDVPMRIAPFSGVYGLSFLFAMTGTALAFAIRKRPRIVHAPVLMLPVLFLLPALPELETGREIAVAAQPDIQERPRWTAKDIETALDRMTVQTREAGSSMKARPNLVLWPEMPAPFYYDDDPMLRAKAAALATSMQSDFLFGGVAHTAKRESLNSVFHVGADGALVSRYDKMNLVPFGEYTPPWVSWVGQVTQEVGGFIPGERSDNLPAGGGKAGVFICYESVFPHYIRKFALDGAGVLVNLSNDGYFGRSAAREQHLAIARMRAVENRRWLLRATNDGISAVIDPAGRITQRLPPFVATATVMRYNNRADLSFYTRNGDWFVWGCLLVGCACCLRSRLTKPKPESL